MKKEKIMLFALIAFILICALFILSKMPAKDENGRTLMKAEAYIFIDRLPSSYSLYITDITDFKKQAIFDSDIDIGILPRHEDKIKYAGVVVCDDNLVFSFKAYVSELDIYGYHNVHETIKNLPYGSECILRVNLWHEGVIVSRDSKTFVVKNGG